METSFFISFGLKIVKKEKKKIDSDVNCGQTARINNGRWKIIVSDATNEIEVLQVHSNCIQFFFP